MRRIALAVALTFGLLEPSPVRAEPLQSFLDLRIKVGHRIQVENLAAVRFEGRVVRLTRDELAIQTGAGEKAFAVADVRELKALRSRRRLGALIGAAVGAGLTLVDCRDGDEPCDLDMPIVLGASVGCIVGARFHKTTTLYPREAAIVSVTPMASRRGIGLMARVRW